MDKNLSRQRFEAHTVRPRMFGKKTRNISNLGSKPFFRIFLQHRPASAGYSENGIKAFAIKRFKVAQLHPRKIGTIPIV